MKKMFICLVCLFLVGCGNLSPRDNLNPSVNNQGRIDKIEQNQQLLRSQIEKLSLINKENNNTGVQILQGDGALILVFGLITIFLILFYYYRTAESYRKTAEILAEQITRHSDESLENNIMKAAEYTDQEERIIALLRKKKLNPSNSQMK